MAVESESTRKTDEELQVMATINRVIVKELEKLKDAESKSRVMAWLKDRHFKGSNGVTE